MRVLVPFDAKSPKTRLSDVFDETQREAFARAMLRDVLEVLETAGHDPRVLATTEIDCSCAVDVDERALSVAVNDRLRVADCPVAVVMADLPLLRVETVQRFVDTDGAVVIAPGIGGGTNALVVRASQFRVDYHGISFRDHRTVAADIGATTTVFDSFRLAQDIDEPPDLVEVLLHSEAEATDWLEQRGYKIDETATEPTLLQSGK